MTTKTKQSLTNLSLLIGCVAGVTALTAPLTRSIAKDAVVAHGESVFVRRDSFALFRERLRSDRQIDSIRWESMRADLDTLKRIGRRASR